MTDETRDGVPSPSAETLLTHGGRHPEQQFGFVNTPVFRGSTVLFKTLDELESQQRPYDYGRIATPLTRDVESVVSELEGAAGTLLAPSGLAAISTALLAVLGAGDDLLLSDSLYEPTRLFATETLKRLGVSARFYDPRIGGDIANLVLPNTRAIFVESPGSHTFEVQDLPAIAAVAAPREIAVIVDNSWATPLFYSPLNLGADIVVHAGTKMFVGHSDAMFGTISANARLLPVLQRTHRRLGVCASPDDTYLAARGLRTLAIRMKEHHARALELAGWLEAQEGVLEVRHPGLASHPDHTLFKRDFRGAGSLFSVLLEPAPRAAAAAFLDGLTLLGMGWSWGGYESLIVPSHPEKSRTAVPWQREGNLFRIHVGFEGVEDLKADLAAGLERYRAAR
jgi:cystathionine beta-lyase